MHKTESAGGVVLNTNGEVLVVNQKGDSWSLPKGHIDEGEDAVTAAKREIEEESGISDMRLVKELGSYERPRIGLGGVGEETSEMKTIHMFLFETQQQELAPEDADHPEARWVKPHNVAELLTHPKDGDFFENTRKALGL
jgi:ADP-ribose pyrophosphatase YjhB (NUDIX family)